MSAQSTRRGVWEFWNSSRLPLIRVTDTDKRLQQSAGRIRAVHPSLQLAANLRPPCRRAPLVACRLSESLTRISDPQPASRRGAVGRSVAAGDEAGGRYSAREGAGVLKGYYMCVYTGEMTSAPRERWPWLRPSPPSPHSPQSASGRPNRPPPPSLPLSSPPLTFLPSPSPPPSRIDIYSIT